MEAAVLNKVDTRAYVERFLASSTRPDGRRWDEFRRSSVTSGSISTALGSSMAKVGRTTVLAGVTGRLVRASASSDSTGAGVAVTVSAESSTLTQRGARIRAAAVSGAIAAWVRGRAATAVDTASLAATDGVAWALTLSIYVLDDVGNVRDAALLAANAALKDTKLPAVRQPGDDADERVLCTVDERKSELRQIECNNIPFSCTFAVCAGNVLADPGVEEEKIADSLLTVLVDENGTLNAVVKPGGVPVSQDVVAKCIVLAQKRGKQLAQILAGRE